MTDTAWLVAIIGAVFAGVGLLLTKLLPYIKRHSERPAAREVVPPPTFYGANPMAFAAPAGDTGRHSPLNYDDIPDTGSIHQALGDIRRTLDHIDSKSFATKDDVRMLSQTFTDRMTVVEARAASNTTKIDVIGENVAYIKGQMSK